MSTCITEKDCKETRHDLRTDFTKQLLLLGDKLDDIKDTINNMRVERATHSQQIVELLGFITGQKELNDSFNIELKNLSDDKMSKNITLTIIGGLISIIGGFFLWSSSQMNDINNKIDENNNKIRTEIIGISSDLSKVLTIFENLKITIN